MLRKLRKWVTRLSQSQPIATPDAAKERGSGTGKCHASAPLQEHQATEANEYSTRGSYGTLVLNKTKDAAVDIVFVHGLTGNRTTTWTDNSSNVLWPRDLLDEKLPNTRIITYGYDADIVNFFSSASQNRIGNYAATLGAALSTLREGTNSVDRPIIFVAHSMGGLLVQDAFLHSKNSAEPHIQRIFSSAKGIIFLGTPHSGSDLATFGLALANLSNVVRTTNTESLRLLKPDSEVLARIEHDFQTTLKQRDGTDGRRKLSVVCFYEELPMPGIGEIVPRHSAILPGHEHYGIHGSHTSMTRFRTAQDSGFVALRGELARWTAEVVAESAPSLRPPPAAAAAAAGPAPASTSDPRTLISAVNHTSGGAMWQGNVFQGPVTFG